VAKERAASQPNGDGKAHAGRDFFSKVNSAALARRAEWVPILHPTAHMKANGAWRITSKNLGRDLQEDLSYHADGIRDHGEEQGLTPIDAVQKFGNAADPQPSGFAHASAAELEANFLSLMDQGLTDDQLKAEMGRDDIDQDIARARHRWQGESQRMRAHAKTAEKRPDTNAPRTALRYWIRSTSSWAGSWHIHQSTHERLTPCGSGTRMRWMPGRARRHWRFCRPSQAPVRPAALK
jgi:hypothetical protein